MILTYKYRLLPKKAQHRALEAILESQRQLYNGALEERIEYYRKTGGSRSWVDQYKSLTECRRELPEMNAIAANIQRATLKRLDLAYAAFFRRLKDHSDKPGFPRFRGKGWFDSFGFACWEGIRLRGSSLMVKGIPGRLRVHLHRPFPDSKPLSCTIKRDTKGWSISISVDVDAAPKRIVSRSAGMDLGLKTLAALSDGLLISNPRPAHKAEREIRRRRRALARCKVESKRRVKVKAKVQRLHAKIARTRRTYLHQQSAMLVRNYDLIAVEALKIKQLTQLQCAASIHDASWATLIEMLRYKAERAGAHLIEVDPSYTSQECPDCGTFAKKTLSQRVHRCDCGCVLDRDVAAARVILSRAVPRPRVDNATQLC